MFSDRTHAGRCLAEKLQHLRDDPDLVVVGLPRGGVPVAAAVAEALGAPLDVILVRKLGVPYQPEVGMGAIGEADVRVVNEDIVRRAGVSETDLAAVEGRERAELERRAHHYRFGRQRIALRGRTVVVVDDGVATGSTAIAACTVARADGAERVILAVPVAPTDWTQRLAGVADEFVAYDTPRRYHAVGQAYQDFTQTSDDEVVRLLRASADRHVHRDPDDNPLGGPRSEHVEIDLGPTTVGGHLTVPERAQALVVFAHGSGSSRHSPRNRYVASLLNDAGLATLLFDLLTSTEELDRTNVFNIELLGNRLGEVTRWVRDQEGFGEVPLGYFGASTGGAAALWAAADDSTVGAVVSRGGRPDLAGPRLGDVRAPTLLVVGGNDFAVLEMNRTALERMVGPHRLSVIPGATHLFEEPGALQSAAELARDWFVEHL